jgi:hypothetical protein
MRFFRRRKDPPAEPPPRTLLTGTVTVAGRGWIVREEKRQGPRTQILILNAVDAPSSEMHIRPDPGNEARALEDVEPLALTPTYRWFEDEVGHRWEARIGLPDPPTATLIKLICWGVGVFEGPYPFDNGLGVRTDAELVALLEDLREDRVESPPR